jgi:hypothetical protein
MPTRLKSTIVVILAILAVWIRPSIAAPLRASAQDAEQSVAVNPEASHEKLETLACDPNDVRYKVKTIHDSVPVPEQPADKALVYVIRPTHYGGSTQTKVAVDGLWVGANEMNNYFYMLLTPGTHYVCSQSENQSVLKL